jgi:hypothetical protein
VQELLWQVAPRKLKPQFTQMQRSPSLKWNETALDQCRIGQDDQWLDYLQHKILMNCLLLLHAIHVLQNWNI